MYYLIIYQKRNVFQCIVSIKRFLYRVLKSFPKYYLGFIVLILIITDYVWTWRSVRNEFSEFVPPTYRKKIYPELGCQFPEVKPFSKIAMKHIRDLPKVVCHGEDWVECNMSECRVTQHILDTTNDVVCYYKDIIYLSDHVYVVADPVKLDGEAVYKLNSSDGIKVSCTGYEKAWFNILTKRWFGYKAGIRPLERTPESNNTINILIVGFDSTSHNGFIRKMPKSYKYLENEMDAVILKGYTPLRDTYQGKMEERLAFMSIILPEGLKRQRPEALYFLKINADILTTPFDIHTTMLDAMGLEKYASDYVVKNAEMKRGLSLFKSIPVSRSCASAGVLPHWCTCMSALWKDVQHDSHTYGGAADALVNFINNITQEKRELCAVRKLISIEWVVSQEIKDLSGNNVIYYQTLVIMSPGRAAFESTMQYDYKKDRFIILETDISRISPYGNEPACVSDTHPRLNKYCYCKSMFRLF